LWLQASEDRDDAFFHNSGKHLLAYAEQETRRPQIKLTKTKAVPLHATKSPGGEEV
jgi:hypothetical protein